MSTKVATVRTGGKNDGGLPVKFEKFAITLPTKKGGDGKNFAPHDLFPNGAKELEIELIYDDPNMILEYGQIGYQTFQDYGKCLIKGDIGSNVAKVFSLTNRNLEAFEMSLDNGAREKYRIKDVGYLKFGIPGVTGIGELAVLKTSSLNSIATMESTLKRLYAITKGKLAGLNLTLSLVPKDTTFFQNGKEKNTSIFFPSLSFRSYTNSSGQKLTGFQGLASFVKDREILIDKELNLAAFFGMEISTIFISDETASESQTSNINTNTAESFISKIENYRDFLVKEGVSGESISDLANALDNSLISEEALRQHFLHLMSDPSHKITDEDIVHILAAQ